MLEFQNIRHGYESHRRFFYFDTVMLEKLTSSECKRFRIFSLLKILKVPPTHEKQNLHCFSTRWK